ncbi:hypothetical protein TrRE_jg3756, partial [Triparma retinervis]
MRCKLWQVGRGDSEAVRLSSPDEFEDYPPTARVHLIIRDPCFDTRLIPRAAFARSSNLVKATLPFAEEICPYAFYGCKNLEEVDAPLADKLMEGCFSHCPKLRSVIIPYGINIGDKVFSNCPALAHVNVDPEARIGSGVFFKCLSLEVLAAAARFNVESGDKTWPAEPRWDHPVTGLNHPMGPPPSRTGSISDPSIGVMSYLQWIQVRSAFVSESRSLGTSLLLMLELCKSDNLLFFTVTPRWLYGRKRATPSPKS